MATRLSKERARPGCGFRRPAGKWDWRDANPDTRDACARGKKAKTSTPTFARSNRIKLQGYYIGKRPGATNERDAFIEDIYDLRMPVTKRPWILSDCGR